MTQAQVKNLVDNLTTVETVSYTSTNTAESSAIANTKGAIVTAKKDLSMTVLICHLY